jgi:hypothetical protein
MVTATQITITLTDSTTINLPLGTAAKDANQTDQSAAQSLISAITRLGGFWDAAGVTWRPLSQIKSIAFS